MTEKNHPMRIFSNLTRRVGALGAYVAVAILLIHGFAHHHGLFCVVCADSCSIVHEDICPCEHDGESQDAPPRDTGSDGAFCPLCALISHGGLDIKAAPDPALPMVFGVEPVFIEKTVQIEKSQYSAVVSRGPPVFSV